jgi:hypothetical protein
VISCDFVVSATGVVPNTELFRGSPVRLDEEGYIEVDDYFQSSVPNVFAAGDCCSYLPKFRSTEFFFQMKLWTQARIMGMFVAQCMSGVAEDYGLDTHLELFTHITRFFGYRVRHPITLLVCSTHSLLLSLWLGGAAGSVQCAGLRRGCREDGEAVLRAGDRWALPPSSSSSSGLCSSSSG